ncbi:MAG: peptidylprolyl isomerase [candidate division WOR-3 bacterium]
MQKIITTTIFIALLCSFLSANNTKNQLDEVYNFYFQGNYHAAEKTLQNLIPNANLKNQYPLLIELGDLYFDKLNELNKAESIYQLIIKLYPKEKTLADIYYRLGLLYEKQEKFLSAAQMYEIVATKYRNPYYLNDALDAIERCFKKNYQERVALIDSYPITRIEFEDRIAMAPGLYETFASKQQLLEEMINDRVMYLEALRQSLNLMPDFLERTTDTRKNSMFQNWYQQEIVNKVKITESDKKKYYAKNKKDFIIPEQASAKEILVLTKEEADSIYQILKDNSAVFESLAQAKSVSPTKKEGGNLGLFRRGTYPEEIENAIFKAKNNTLLAPIYSQAKGGYVIIKVEEIRPKQERKYKDVAAEIEHRLRAQIIDETFKKKTDAFRKACQITINEQAISQNLDTIALINNQPITQQDINQYISRIPPFYRSEFESPEGKRRILDQIILEKTWLFQLEKDKYYLKNAVFAQVQENKRGNLISMIRKNEVSDKVFISDDDAMKVYKQNLSEYKVPKQIRTREITVNSESLAQAIYKMLIKDKLPFDSLARTYSIAPTKRTGGDMGFYSAGNKIKEIEDVAFKLKVGEISKVIKQNDTTYTIIKLEEVKAPYTKSFDEVKASIIRKLRIDKDKELFDRFINEAKSRYQIQRFLTEETETPETPQEK